MSPPVEAVERSLNQWDSHIDGCSSCLVGGDYLCYEGEVLTEKVVAARIAMTEAAAAPVRGSVFQLFRWPTSPGVGA